MSNLSWEPETWSVLKRTVLPHKLSLSSRHEVSMLLCWFMFWVTKPFQAGHIWTHELDLSIGAWEARLFSWNPAVTSVAPVMTNTLFQKRKTAALAARVWKNSIHCAIAAWRRVRWPSPHQSAFLSWLCLLCWWLTQLLPSISRTVCSTSFGAAQMKRL